MDSLLKEINMLPGVFGCFVYTGNQELVAEKLPPSFKADTIMTMGNLLTRSIKMGTMTNLDLTSIEFKFDESLLIVKPLAEGAVLVMACEPAVNKSLLNMTISMLINDIQNAINKAPTAIAQPPTQTETMQTQTISAASAEPVREHREAEIDAALAPVLVAIKGALAYAIGPIAGQIMEETIEIWALQGAKSKRQLPALATLLCNEINDKELEAEFMGQIRPLL
jgi:predicted regulator of Ras-like GTPase activity (Roadblock/LC7/MglB family)